MFFYELCLIPWIYLRIVYNVLKTEDNKPFACLISISWLIIGPFYLIWALILDMKYYMKVLVQYNEDFTIVGQDDKTLEDKL